MVILERDWSSLWETAVILEGRLVTVVILEGDLREQGLPKLLLFSLLHAERECVYTTFINKINLMTLTSPLTIMIKHGENFSVFFFCDPG